MKATMSGRRAATAVMMASASAKIAAGEFGSKRLRAGAKEITPATIKLRAVFICKLPFHAEADGALICVAISEVFQTGIDRSFAIE